MKRCITFVFLSWVLINSAISQKALDKTISLSFTNKNFVRVLYDLEKSHALKFYFDPKRIPYFVYTKSYENKQIWYIIQDLLSGALLKVISIDNNTIGIIPTGQLNKTYINELVDKWQKGVYAYPFKEETITMKFTKGMGSSNSPKKVNLTLNIYDEDHQDALIGVSLFSDDYSINGVTDANGSIHFELPTGISLINTNYIGYQNNVLEFELYEDAVFNIPMKKSALLLEEVEISAQKLVQNKLEKTIGVESIEMKKIESITQALGEVDIIKSLEILPGVKSTAEVSSGFNVRGGNIDENMVILNDAVVFNPTHVLGFTSAFNADAIQSVTLSKAYIDAQYGGWNSSVLDIKTHFGNDDQWKGTGSIGTAIGKLTVNGPVSKKITMMASIRKSYSSWLLKQAYNKEISNSTADFYDYNLSIKYKLNKNHFILTDHFRSGDVFNYNKEFGYNWSNTTAGMSLISNWDDKLTSKINFSWSRFRSTQSSYTPPRLFDLDSGIDVLKGSLQFNYSLSNPLTLKTGLNVMLFDFSPEKISTSAPNSITQTTSVFKNDNIQLAPFFTLGWEANSRFRVETGLRYSQYYRSGFRTEYEYLFKDRYVVNEISDTLQITNTEKLAGYIEPRINVHYKISERIALKSAYTRTSQNLHLLVNGNTSLPSDVWVPSGKYIKPRLAQQISAGFGYASKNQIFAVSSDLYYKLYENNVILKNFPDIIQNEHIETEVLQGRAYSYGFELAVDIQKGNLTGNIAYTYARTFQKNTNSNYDVNSYVFFAADNDIPHQLNLLLNYRSNSILSFNCNFIFKNGRPVTLPESTVIIDDFLIPVYSDRNVFRLPDYLRLDIGCNFDFRKVRNTGVRHSFSIGVYNLFGRKNALNIFYRKSENGNIEGYKLSLIGAAIPSLSWNFVF